MKKRVFSIPCGFLLLVSVFGPGPAAAGEAEVLSQGASLGGSLTGPYKAGYDEGLREHRARSGTDTVKGTNPDGGLAGLVSTTFVVLRECQTAIEGLNFDASGADAGVPVPDPQQPYVGQSAEKVRAQVAEAFERRVRTFVGGTKQLRLDLGGSAGSAEIPGLYEGYMPDLVTAGGADGKEVIKGTYMREWGSCTTGGIANLSNGDKKWFKSAPPDSGYRAELVQDGKLVNHRCPGKKLDTSPELIPVRGRIVDIMMTVMSRMIEQIRAGKVPGPQSFPSVGAKDVCSPIAMEIEKTRKAVRAQTPPGAALSCDAAGADAGGVGCAVAGAQSHIEFDLVPLYAYCTWRTLVDQLMEQYRKHCLMSLRDRDAKELPYCPAALGWPALFLVLGLLAAGGSGTARADGPAPPPDPLSMKGDCGTGFFYSPNPMQIASGKFGPPIHLKFVVFDPGDAKVDKTPCNGQGTAVGDPSAANAGGPQSTVQGGAQYVAGGGAPGNVVGVTQSNSGGSNSGGGNSGGSNTGGAVQAVAGGGGAQAVAVGGDSTPSTACSGSQDADPLAGAVGILDHNRSQGGPPMFPNAVAGAVVGAGIGLAVGSVNAATIIPGIAIGAAVGAAVGAYLDPDRIGLTVKVAEKYYYLKYSHAMAINNAGLGPQANWPSLCDYRCGQYQHSIDLKMQAHANDGSGTDPAAEQKYWDDAKAAALERCRTTPMELTAMQVINEGPGSGNFMPPTMAMVRQIIQRSEETCVCQMSVGNQFDRSGTGSAGSQVAAVKAALGQVMAMSGKGGAVNRVQDGNHQEGGPSLTSGAAATAGGPGSLDNPGMRARGAAEAKGANGDAAKGKGTGVGAFAAGGPGGGGDGSLGAGGTAGAGGGSSGSSAGGSGSAAMAGGGGGVAAGGAAALDGDGGGGGGGPASMDFAGAPADGTNPMGSDDPADYLIRIGLKESLFHVVEKRYKAKALLWGAQDGKHDAPPAAVAPPAPPVTK